MVKNKSLLLSHKIPILPNVTFKDSFGMFASAFVPLCTPGWLFSRGLNYGFSAVMGSVNESSPHSPHCPKIADKVWAT